MQHAHIYIYIYFRVWASGGEITRRIFYKYAGLPEAGILGGIRMSLRYVSYAYIERERET